MSHDRILRWSFLGTMGFRPANRLQERLRRAIRRDGGDDHLLLLEHSPVYTLGRSADGTDVVAPREWMLERGIELAEVDRGGQVTYHGPGQLVGYPVIDLNPDRRDIRRYVRDLQEILVRTLADLGVEARADTRQSLIGVWVGPLKIASIGVHVSRWITTHGFALNLSTDLSHFEGIVACGLPGVKMTSVESLIGDRLDLGEIACTLAEHFGERFERELEWVDAAELIGGDVSDISRASA